MANSARYHRIFVGGVYDGEDITWRWAKSGEPLGWTNWYRDDPNNMYTDRCLGQIETKEWFNLACDGNLPFLFFVLYFFFIVTW